MSERCIDEMREERDRVIKVSVVIPVYNTEKYLRQCMESVVSQSLRDLEIICVNDGSTDHSGDILEEFAQKDTRVVIIDKPNSGYGHSMNCGFDRACGEYIGILESDDYAEPEMFERLYNEAKAFRLDVIKSGFYYYWTEPAEKNIAESLGFQWMQHKTFCPGTAFSTLFEQAEFFNIKPTIWSAIYRRDFIRKNHIRFNETPGASYQDTGFNFKVLTCAERVRLSSEYYVHYRQDSIGSSINSSGKVFCICDEYDEMKKFLTEKTDEKSSMQKILARLKFDSYIWNYERLSEPLQRSFLKKASEEFAEDLKKGYLDQKLYSAYKWKSLMAVIYVPEEYHAYRMALRKGEKYHIKWPDGIKPGVSFYGSVLTGVVGIRQQGLLQTGRRILRNLIQK